MKGRDAERAVQAGYERHGYEVYQPPKAKFREQDIFGLFDLLAKRHSDLVGIQVKGGADASGITEFFELAAEYERDLECFRAVFIHLAGRSWRVAHSTADGYEWVFDGREESRDSWAPGDLSPE